MTTQDILHRLKGVKKQGSGWVAICPAHQDKSPSLSIDDGDEGTLLHCHAGCTYKQIMDALNLSEKDGFRDDGTNEPEAIYDYHDPEGAVAYQVLRYRTKDGKTFKQRKDEQTWSMSGVTRYPYNLPAVIEQAKKGGVVLVVEGEKDVESCRSRGIVATCNSGGAEKWRDEFADYLTGAYVVIVVDKDEPGRRHGDMVAKSLSGKARTVKIMQAKKGKDISDHFAAGLNVKDLVPVRKALLPGVMTFSDIADMALRAMAQQQKQTAIYSNPWGLAEPQYAPGRMYMIGGYTGHGKTVFALNTFRYLAEARIRVCYLTNEMTAHDVTNRLLCNQGFDLKELEQPWLMQSETERERLREEIEVMRGWNAEIIFDTGATAEKADQYLSEGAYEFLIVDHLHRISTVRQGEEAAIANEVGSFVNLSLNHDIPILLVGQLRRPHPGMGLPQPGLHDFKGSGAIEQEAAMVMAVWSQPSELGTAARPVELSILKNRYGKSGVTEFLSMNGPEFRLEKRQA